MWVLLVSACHRDRTPGAAPEDRSTAATGETGVVAHTGDTGDTSDTPPEPYDPRYPLTPPDRAWLAAEAWDQAGRGLDVGDADDDGLAEVLIGTPSTFLYGPDPGAHSGAYLLDVETSSGVIDEVATAEFHGHPWWNGDLTGLYVATVGDVTGDGASDVAIRITMQDDPPVLALPVFAGPLLGYHDAEDAWAWLSIESGNPNPPNHPAGCGDVTGDGLVDLAFAADISVTGTATSSKVYVLAGPLQPGVNPIEDADVEVLAPVTEGIGVRVAGRSDLTGDGVNDLLVGADERDGRRGGAYLVSDLTLGLHDVSEAALFAGVDPDEQAGLGLAVGGDLDGDGLEDAYVGAHVWNERRGRGFVVTSKVDQSLLDAHLQLQGEEDLDWFGVAGAIGDFDGDGASDLAVGISRDIYFGLDSPGRVALFRGPLVAGVRSAQDADGMLRASDAPDSLGFEVDAGDMDGDGLDDLAVGAPFDATAGDDAGAVYVFLGATLPW